MMTASDLLAPLAALAAALWASLAGKGRRGTRPVPVPARIPAGGGEAGDGWGRGPARRR